MFGKTAINLIKFEGNKMAEILIALTVCALSVLMFNFYTGRVRKLSIALTDYRKNTEYLILANIELTKQLIEARALYGDFRDKYYATLKCTGGINFQLLCEQQTRLIDDLTRKITQLERENSALNLGIEFRERDAELLIQRLKRAQEQISALTIVRLAGQVS